MSNEHLTRNPADGASTAPSSAAPSSAAPSSAAPFIRACAISDIPDNGTIGVEIGGEPVALVKTGGEVFAIRDVCSHAEIALSEGEVYDHTIECWLHGSCFDLRTGEPTALPATDPVPVYPVKTEGDDVFVAVKES
jgi:3-phenylpropionate/trans-cinnamate dioxygenase ferredoxin subunit